MHTATLKASICLLFSMNHVKNIYIITSEDPAMYHFIFNIDCSHQLLLRNLNETYINTKYICQVNKSQVPRGH